MESGFQKAGFPSKPTRSPGVQYSLPGMDVRIMEKSGPAPLRASFQHKKGSPIDPFTGKPVQNIKNLFSAEQRELSRNLTHIELHNDI